jgi:hypothetical protein
MVYFGVGKRGQGKKNLNFYVGILSRMRGIAPLSWDTVDISLYSTAFRKEIQLSVQEGISGYLRTAIYLCKEQLPLETLYAKKHGNLF